jgi:hypothetical protein
MVEAAGDGHRSSPDQRAMIAAAARRGKAGI